MPDRGSGTDGGAKPQPRRRFFDVELLAALPRWLLLAVVAALALTVVFFGLPPRPILLRVVQKLGHAGVFALVALALLGLARRRPLPRPAWHDYALALAGCVALGAATEVAQAFTHRDPSWLDVGRDARGALCALLVAAACDWRVDAGRAPRRGLSLALAGALALWIVAPLLTALAAYGHRGLNFPTLFAAGGTLDLYFLEPGRQSIELAHSADGATLRIRLRERPTAGVELSEPSPDWRGYHALRIDVRNPSAAPLNLHVRIDDAHHNSDFDDRYNGAFTIAGGERRTLEIPLSRIAAAPRGRQTDLKHIARILLFRNGDAPDEFDLNRIALE